MTKQAFVGSLETRLSMIGYDVVTAADGEEALDTFRNTIPDSGRARRDDAQARRLWRLSGAAQRVRYSHHYADGAR